MGIWEVAGMGYHVVDVQMTWTDEPQMLTSHGSHTSQSHKSITQMNRTNESHKMIMQNKMTSRNGNDE